MLVTRALPAGFALMCARGLPHILSTNLVVGPQSGVKRGFLVGSLMLNRDILLVMTAVDSRESVRFRVDVVTSDSITSCV